MSSATRVEKNESHASATTTDADIHITPSCPMFTAARCPSQSLTNVGQILGREARHSRGRSGCEAEVDEQARTVTPLRPETTAVPREAPREACESPRVRRERRQGRSTNRAPDGCTAPSPADRAPARYQPAPSIATASTPVDSRPRRMCVPCRAGTAGTRCRTRRSA